MNRLFVELYLEPLKPDAKDYLHHWQVVDHVLAHHSTTWML